MSRTTEVLAALRDLLPGLKAGFGAVESADPDLPLPEGAVLLPGEEAGRGGGRVVPARQAEFLAGRLAARAALAELGLPPQAIPRGEDRAPVWPAGIRGSLTHTGGLALAVVTAAGELSPGLDLEPDDDLPAELVPVLLTPAERAWAAAQPEPLRAARLIFVAKEAGYKAQYPLSGALIGFHEAEFESTAPGEFTLRLLRAAGPLPEGHPLPGRWTRRGGFLLAAVTCAAVQPTGAEPEVAL